MGNSANEAGRADFEAWFCYPGEMYLKRDGDSYGLMSARTSWRAWQAGIENERERCLYWCSLGDHEGYLTHHIGNGTPKPP